MTQADSDLLRACVHALYVNTLQNQGLIDKTILINVELKRVDKPGQRGYKKAV